ncbi:MAG: hypothetical protein KKA79_00635, partial [Nanoarchaeota archaeon]|nr:hypothetical protein [Nanoarchaeota archaeon]
AFVHGKFPIILNVFEGVKGIAIRIEDFGKGFDFKKTQKNYMEGEKYFNNHGCGFSFYNQKEHLVSFENEGTALNILHFFNQNDLKQKLAAENRIKG